MTQNSKKTAETSTPAGPPPAPEMFSPKGKQAHPITKTWYDPKKNVVMHLIEVKRQVLKGNERVEQTIHRKVVSIDQPLIDFFVQKREDEAAIVEIK